MTTIQILQEQPRQGKLRCRAISGRYRATGATPGAALDALEKRLPAESGTVVILQKFKVDRYFGEQRRARLAELMGRLQASRAEGQELAPPEMAELEALVEQELRATVWLTQDIQQQTTGQ